LTAQKARIPAGTKLPLELLCCQRGETSNQLKWLCVWQFNNCGPLCVVALYRVLRYLLIKHFSKLLQVLVATVSTMLSSRRAEFKSFCNSIGWHSSHSFNQILQGNGKAVYQVWELDMILYFFLHG